MKHWKKLNKGRANTGIISFVNLCGGQFTSSTQLIILNIITLLHSLTNAVPNFFSELYPLY